MGALDIAVTGPAIPAIKESFGITVRDTSWIFNIYLIAHLVAVPFMAKLSDTYGRRNIYIIDVALFAIGSLIIVLSGNFEVFLLGRAIQGFGAGGIFPVASAVIGDVLPKERQGSALGLIGAVFGAAFILGPIIGGILLLFNWHLIFAINIPIAFVIIYFSFKLLPTVVVVKKSKFDYLGLVLLSVILLSLSYTFNTLDFKNAVTSLTQNYNFILIIIAVILIPILVLIEKKADNPIIQPKLFTSKELIYTYSIAFGAGFVESCAMYFPLFSKYNFGLTDSSASFMLIPMVLSMLIGAPLAGKLIDKKGARLALGFGSILLTTGLLTFIAFGSSYFGFYAGGILIGIGLASLLGAPLRYIINSECDITYRASGQGIVTISTSSGHILSTAILAALLNGSDFSVANFQISYSVLMIAAICIFILTLMLKKK